MNLYQDTDKYKCHVYKDREEWKSKRIKGIGGSDASALIGQNPWKSNSTLWKEKKGIITPEDISDKSYVKFGTEAEQHIRALYALENPQYDVQYMDNVTLQSVEYPWMLYSPDGLLYDKETGRRGILEIKTTNILQSMQREKWKGQVPMNYYIQVLHGLLVTGFDFVVLKARLKTVYHDDVRVEVKHYIFTKEEKQQDLEFLLENELSQWNEYYVENKEPATMLPEI